MTTIDFQKPDWFDMVDVMNELVYDDDYGTGSGDLMVCLECGYEGPQELPRHCPLCLTKLKSGGEIID